MRPMRFSHLPLKLAWGVKAFCAANEQTASIILANFSPEIKAGTLPKITRLHFHKTMCDRVGAIEPVFGDSRTLGFMGTKSLCRKKSQLNSNQSLFDSLHSVPGVLTIRGLALTVSYQPFMVKDGWTCGRVLPQQNHSKQRHVFFRTWALVSWSLYESAVSLAPQDSIVSPCFVSVWLP